MSEPMTFADARELKAQGDLARFIKTHMSEAQRVAAYRRALVLRYPDLAAKLTESPLRFTAPKHWNGYIPPATWNQAMNTYSGRPVLLALVAEAERRRDQPQETAAELEEAA
ncbi:hypothetical protein ACIRF8_15180 [Streptomyces sp. NPDC102406]|uniref:hypothetical protein n=1 Tax=Streptomyces sp. NPDC102406 TaxID=3366171 RepID=UPI0037F6A839